MRVVIDRVAGDIHAADAAAGQPAAGNPASGNGSVDAAKARNRVLIVFLPGSADLPEDLVAQGFVDQVRQRRINADVALPAAHARYYTSGSFEQRLREDVIDPALAHGYREIWLAGISLGGFGALMYARRYPEVVDGLIVLAPFIASNPVLDEVTSAGGLSTWSVPVEQDDWQRGLLGWLKGYAEPGTARPPLLIGYGTQDGFDQMREVFGDILPPRQLQSAPGGHDWAPWQSLWSGFLDQAVQDGLLPVE